MKQKVMFGLMGVGILAGLSLTLYMTLNKEVYQEPIKNTPQVQQEKPKEEPKPSDVTSSTKTSKVDLDNIYEKPKEQPKRALSPGEVTRHENDARKLFREYKFLDGANTLQQIVKETEKTGNTAILHQLFYEASLLSSVTPLEKDSLGHAEPVSKEGIRNIFNEIRDPENILLGAFMLHYLDRANIIVNKDSLNPIVWQKIRILNHEMADAEFFNEVKLLHENMVKMHRILIEADGTRLYGYVMEFADGRAKLYSIQEVTPNTTHFKTIAEWEELHKKLDENLK